MSRMPTGTFEMAPLSEFVVTQRFYRRADLPTVNIFQWCRDNSVEYIVDQKTFTMIIDSEIPSDVNPVLLSSDVDAGWKIVWKDKK